MPMKSLCDIRVFHFGPGLFISLTWGSWTKTASHLKSVFRQAHASLSARDMGDETVLFLFG